MSEVVESRKSNSESPSVFASRREQMLRDKIDYASSKRACNKELALLVEVAAVSPLPITTHCAGAPVITWFIENYPASANETKDNQNNTTFWEQFK